MHELRLKSLFQKRIKDEQYRKLFEGRVLFTEEDLGRSGKEVYFGYKRAGKLDWTIYQEVIKSEKSFSSCDTVVKPNHPDCKSG